MATIKDVAQEAGVSIATVSNYINKTKPIGREKADRIAGAGRRTFDRCAAGRGRAAFLHCALGDHDSSPRPHQRHGDRRAPDLPLF